MVALFVSDHKKQKFKRKSRGWWVALSRDHGLNLKTITSPSPEIGIGLKFEIIAIWICRPTLETQKPPVFASETQF